MRFTRHVPAVLCLALSLPAISLAQMGGSSQPASGATIAPAESFNALESMLEHEIVGAAEAMPADKYDFSPPTSDGDFKGVRTFSQQVKHLAEANYMMFHGWGAGEGVDRKTIEAMTSKDDIVNALKKSYEYAHAAINTMTPENAFTALPGPPNRKMTRASAAAFAMAHSMDHYGQMVEYLRMNGIVPPASRPAPKSGGGR